MYRSFGAEIVAVESGRPLLITVKMMKVVQKRKPSLNERV